MNPKFNKLEIWFDEYVKRFSSSNETIQQNFDIKFSHTKNVCDNINFLSIQLNLSEKDLFISQTAALFHDIGRFEQFKRYQTFADKLSIDHAQLGVEILIQENIFKNIEEDSTKIILNAIANHNKLHVPDHLDEKSKFFTKLLRDADKIDILRLVSEYYQQQINNGAKNNAIVLGLPDNSNYSNKIIEDILNKEFIKSQDLKTVNDFKLLQMSWIFDINFIPTFQILKNKKYIEKIFMTLPKDYRILQSYSVIDDYLNENCNKENKSILF